MIVVKVELHSVITGQVSEIGRMLVCNEGGTNTLGDYGVYLLRRNSKKVQRRGEVKNHPRLGHSVWRLVAKALRSILGEETALHDWDALDKHDETSSGVGALE